MNLHQRESDESALLHHNTPDHIFIASFPWNLTSFAAPAAKNGLSNYSLTQKSSNISTPLLLEIYRTVAALSSTRSNVAKEKNLALQFISKSPELQVDNFHIPTLLNRKTVCIMHATRVLYLKPWSHGI